MDFFVPHNACTHLCPTGALDLTTAYSVVTPQCIIHLPLKRIKHRVMLTLSASLCHIGDLQCDSVTDHIRWLVRYIASLSTHASCV